MTRIKKGSKYQIKDMPMFLAMRDIFIGGDFVYWLNKQNLSMGAHKEYEEALRYFEKKTGLKVPGWEEDDVSN